MIRSYSREYDDYGSNNNDKTTKLKNHKNIQTHSRNNSHDLNKSLDFRQELTHSRTNSRDEQQQQPAFNIKYILNHFKKDGENYEKGGGGNSGASGYHRNKKHSRNLSYDQIYLPNNIRFDSNDLFNKGKKNVNLVKNVEIKVKNSNEMQQQCNSSNNNNSHSRNNSKDFNNSCNNNSNNNNGGNNNSSGVGGGIIVSNNAIVNCKEVKPLVEVPLSASSILRHRRTNSKDLKMIVTPIDSVGIISSSSLSSSSGMTTGSSNSSNNNSNNHKNNSCIPISSTSSSNSNPLTLATAIIAPATITKHKRNSSQHKIQIENDSESSQLLLGRNSHSEDNLNIIDDSDTACV